MSSQDEAGLGLFDDTATAAGSFPGALRGYDRTAVDDYVRSLEAAVVAARQHIAGQERRIAQMHQDLTRARAGSPDALGQIGDRTGEILRVAEEQAADIVARAGRAAEQALEEARREADRLRQAGGQEGAEARTSGLAEVEDLRRRLREDTERELARIRAEGEAVVAAARRQADSLRQSAEHDAQTVRYQAQLDADQVRRAAEAEVAEARRRLAVDQERATEELRARHDDYASRVEALLAEATAHNQESAQRLEEELAQVARIRTEALAEANRVTEQATVEATDLVRRATEQADAIRLRTQQEFAWRRQELKRESELLNQRKQAVLSQIASLSALAEETKHSFPDVSEPHELHDAEPARSEQDRGAAPAPEQPVDDGGTHHGGTSVPDVDRESPVAARSSAGDTPSPDEAAAEGSDPAADRGPSPRARRRPGPTSDSPPGVRRGSR